MCLLLHESVYTADGSDCCRRRPRIQSREEYEQRARERERASVQNNRKKYNRTMLAATIEAKCLMHIVSFLFLYTEELVIYSRLQLMCVSVRTLPNSMPERVYSSVDGVGSERERNRVHIMRRCVWLWVHEGTTTSIRTLFFILSFTFRQQWFSNIFFKCNEHALTHSIRCKCRA